MSVPFHNTAPEVGFAMVARIRISVDFPAPFGPSKPSTPGASSSVKSRSAHTFPSYCLLTPWISNFKPSSCCRSSAPFAPQASSAPVAGRCYISGTQSGWNMFLENTPQCEGRGRMLDSRTLEGKSTPLKMESHHRGTVTGLAIAGGRGKCPGTDKGQGFVVQVRPARDVDRRLVHLSIRANLAADHDVRHLAARSGLWLRHVYAEGLAVLLARDHRLAARRRDQFAGIERALQFLIRLLDRNPRAIFLVFEMGRKQSAAPRKEGGVVIRLRSQPHVHLGALLLVDADLVCGRLCAVGGVE